MSILSGIGALFQGAADIVLSALNLVTCGLLGGNGCCNGGTRTGTRTGGGCCGRRGYGRRNDVVI